MFFYSLRMNSTFGSFITPFSLVFIGTRGEQVEIPNRKKASRHDPVVLVLVLPTPTTKKVNKLQTGMHSSIHPMGTGIENDAPFPDYLYAFRERLNVSLL